MSWFCSTIRSRGRIRIGATGHSTGKSRQMAPLLGRRSRPALEGAVKGARFCISQEERDLVDGNGVVLKPGLGELLSHSIEDLAEGGTLLLQAPAEGADAESKAPSGFFLGCAAIGHQFGEHLVNL